MKSFKVRADDLLDEYDAAAGLLSREEHRARFSALRAKVEKAVKEAESEQTNNGGPAFPVADLAWPEPKNTDEAVRAASGMTLRDYFAAKALSGVASNPESGCNSPSDLAHWSFRVADAMLKARGEEK